MPYIAPEVITQARQVDLLTYMQRCEPDELVLLGNGNYCTKTHDSLKISNGKWYWFSQGFGGHTALDYLIKVQQLPARHTNNRRVVAYLRSRGTVIAHLCKCGCFGIITLKKG